MYVPLALSLTAAMPRPSLRRGAPLLPRVRLLSASASASAAAERQPELLLTDAMPLLYRAHFSFTTPGRERLRSRSGLDTTVVFAFMRTLLPLIAAWRPTHACVVFDPGEEDGPPEAGAAWSEGWSPRTSRMQAVDATAGPGRTWRHALYPEYKSSREPTPPEIRAAVPLLRELLSAAGVPHLTVAGVEADDVLATLALRTALPAGAACLIASPDKDFQQLLSPGLRMLRPRNGGEFELFTEAEFAARYARLPPPRFADLLALAGDASDNIPGVAGIGEKTALALLAKAEEGGCGGLEGVLALGGEGCGERARRALAAPGAAEAARLSLRLAQLSGEVEVPALRQPLEAWALRPPADRGEALRARLNSLDIYTMEQHIRALLVVDAEPEPF